MFELSEQRLVMKAENEKRSWIVDIDIPTGYCTSDFISELKALLSRFCCGYHISSSDHANIFSQDISRDANGQSSGTIGAESIVAANQEIDLHFEEDDGNW